MMFRTKTQIPEKVINLFSDVERWLIIYARYRDDERTSQQRYIESIYNTFYPTDKQIHDFVVEKLNAYIAAGVYPKKVNEIEKDHAEMLNKFQDFKSYPPKMVDAIREDLKKHGYLPDIRASL